MSERKPVVGMSLKIYQNKLKEAAEFAENIGHFVRQEKEVELFLFPSLGALYPVAETLKDSPIGVGAQNIAPKANGAYTGEFSIESLMDMGGQYVEIGHSERRAIFQETDEMIQQKVALTLAHGLTPVLCIGEPEKTADYDEIERFLKQQILLDLHNFSAEQLKRVILAYEPVWAIGAAEAAGTEHVQVTFNLLRKILSERFGAEVAQAMRIIYGGSVSKENVVEIAKIESLDGVFIGRFGHDPKNYNSIVETVKREKLKV